MFLVRILFINFKKVFNYDIGFEVVTLYATLGTDALRYGIIETNSQLIISSIDQMKKIEVIQLKVNE